jgi:hypothetical protein
MMESFQESDQSDIKNFKLNNDNSDDLCSLPSEVNLPLMTSKFSGNENPDLKFLAQSVQIRTHKDPIKLGNPLNFKKELENIAFHYRWNDFK